MFSTYIPDGEFQILVLDCLHIEALKRKDYTGINSHIYQGQYILTIIYFCRVESGSNDEWILKCVQYLPMVGMGCMNSSCFSLKRMVVFPAPSRPRVTTRISIFGPMWTRLSWTKQNLWLKAWTTARGGWLWAWNLLIWILTRNRFGHARRLPLNRDDIYYIR